MDNEVTSFVYKNDNINGILMVFIASASIFLDVWDLTAFSFVITFFKDEFLPSGLILGISVSAANIGAIAGAIIGGYLTDKLGRKKLLIYNMLIFTVFSILIAASANLYEFIIFRLIMGFSIGSDVATGFSYIYEYISKKQRNRYYSLWAYSFSLVALMAIFSVFLLKLYINNNSIWRYIFVIGGIFAAVILLLRTRLMETPIWLYNNGNYHETENVIRKVYGESLKIDKNSGKLRVNIKNIIKIFKIKMNREILFFLSLNGIVGFIGWGFSFYITYMLVVLKFFTFYQDLEADALIYSFGFIGAVISPVISRKFGIYRSSVIPSIIATLSILALFFVFSKLIPAYFTVPLSALIILMNYSGPMAYNAILNDFIPAELRGVANGWNYMFNKITEAVSGLSAGVILVLVGIKYNTLILFLTVAVFTAIALVTGRSKYFRKDYVSDFQTSESE